MNELAPTTSLRRRLSKIGLTLITLIVGTVVLIIPLDTTSAGGGCSTTTGNCTGSIIEHYDA